MRADLAELKQRIERGEYEVDADAIARAIIRRRTPGQTVSEVLVPTEVDRGPVRSDEAEPPSRRDVA